MDSNRDDAEMCVKIGRAALGDGDHRRAFRFALKAQRLYPSPQADDLLSDLQKAEMPRRSGADCTVSEEESWRFSAKGGNPNDGGHERKAASATGAAASATDDGGHEKKAASATGAATSTTDATPSVTSATPSATDATVSATEATAEQVEIVRRINKTKGLYEILGLSKGCSVEDVRRAYRRVSLRVHPDKNKAEGAEAAFKAVSKAFRCLSDADRRRKYDLYGSEDAEGLTQQQGTGRRWQNGNAFYEETFDPNEVFQAFFSGMQGGEGAFGKTSFAFGHGSDSGRRGNGVTQVYSVNVLGLVQVLAILALFILSNFF